ncbi:hypothetical protein [Kribbella endophytica]
MGDEAVVAGTRDSYDWPADGQPEVVASELDDRVLDQTLFSAFAEMVKAGGGGPVADVGCGSDEVAAFLREAGFGLWTTAVREPEGSEKAARPRHPAADRGRGRGRPGYLLARKASEEPW